MLLSNINTYLKNIDGRLKYIEEPALRRAALNDILVQAKGIVRLVKASLGNDIEPLISAQYPKNIGSITAQNAEITAQSHINGSCIVCGADLKGKRKGAVYCSKNCNNINRNQK